MVDQREGGEVKNMCLSGSSICRGDTDWLCQSMEGAWISQGGSFCVTLSIRVLISDLSHPFGQR